MSEVFELTFQNTQYPNISYHPTELKQGKIIITMPFDSNIENAEMEGMKRGNKTQTNCGSWINEMNEWNSNGCEVTSTTDEYIICECTHASDYSAWEEFIEDVENTFESHIGIVATILILVLSILFPLLFLL